MCVLKAPERYPFVDLLRDKEGKQRLGEFFILLLKVQFGQWRKRLKQEPVGFLIDGYGIAGGSRPILKTVGILGMAYGVKHGERDWFSKQLYLI